MTKLRLHNRYYNLRKEISPGCTSEWVLRLDGHGSVHVGQKDVKHLSRVSAKNIPSPRWPVHTRGEVTGVKMQQLRERTKGPGNSIQLTTGLRLED